MKKLLIFFALLLAPSVIADSIYNSENLFIHIDIHSTAEILQTAPGGHAERAAINVTFYPKQTATQEVLKLETTPDAEINDKTLVYKWKNPEGNLGYSAAADVKTSAYIAKVRHKIDFPLKNIPEDVLVYTKASPTIDSNDDAIIRTASELVKGEDDMYSAVFKIADWTKNNVEYNLSTLTADVSQKASWVLQNKQGVCDELTSLFIALLRSVGIPGRFVSGIAYTNSELFPDKWGPHGWAEVYFPEYGWVPFDVTYGEYGWADATHVKFKDTIDSDEASTYYEWLGSNVDVRTNKLNITAHLTGQDGRASSPLNIQAATLKKSVGFGSYNLVEADVENTGDFYYGTEMYIVKPKEVETEGKELQSVLLLPHEKKKVFWILKIGNNLNSKYIYTFPIVVGTVDNITSETSFTSTSKDAFVTSDEVGQVARLYGEEKEKKYSGNVVLECAPSKSEIYEYEAATVSCTAKNTGNVFLDNVAVCFESQCSKTSLGISQSKSFDFNVDTKKSGSGEMPVTLSNELVSKTSYVSIKVNDLPQLAIEEVAHPENVSYDENFTVSFVIAKKSQSNPKNIRVSLRQNGAEQSWLVNEMTKDKKFDVSILGSQLKYGKNDYEISISYHDERGKQYSLQKGFLITLAGATIFQRISLSMNNLQGVSNEAISIMLLTGTIVFMVIVYIVFRRANKGEKY